MVYATVYVTRNQECMPTIPALLSRAIVLKKQMNQCINSDLEDIRLWLAANKLTLILTKMEFLLIGSRHLPENPSIKINQIPVEQVSTAKSLSVYIDENLNWEFQIKEI